MDRTPSKDGSEAVDTHSQSLPVEELAALSAVGTAHRDADRDAADRATSEEAETFAGAGRRTEVAATAARVKTTTAGAGAGAGVGAGVGAGTTPAAPVHTPFDDAVYAALSANSAVEVTRREMAAVAAHGAQLEARLDTLGTQLHEEVRKAHALAEEAKRDARIARRSAAASVSTTAEAGIGVTIALRVSAQTRERVDGIEERVRSACVAATSATAIAETAAADAVGANAKAADAKAAAADAKADSAQSAAAAAAAVAGEAFAKADTADEKAQLAGRAAQSAWTVASAAAAEAHSATKIATEAQKATLAMKADEASQLKHKVDALEDSFNRHIAARQHADGDTTADPEFVGMTPPAPTAQLNTCARSVFVGLSAEELLATLLETDAATPLAEAPAATTSTTLKAKSGAGIGAGASPSSAGVGSAPTPPPAARRPPASGAGTGAGAGAGAAASLPPPAATTPPSDPSTAARPPPPALATSRAPTVALRHSGVSAGGGFGKSLTAAQALHLLRTKYDTTASLYGSGMYWVAVESMATAERDVRAMVSQIPSLRKLVGESLTLTGSDLMAAVARWLRHRDRRGWLLVLDNADNKEVLEEVVSALLPPLSDGGSLCRGHVVVTSRLSSSVLASVMPGMQSQTLSALASCDAESLLWEGAYGCAASDVSASELSRRGVTAEAETAAVREVAGPSGAAGLPLALAHAVVSVRSGRVYGSYVSYAEGLRAKRTALFAEGWTSSELVSSGTSVREWAESQRPRWPAKMIDHVVEVLAHNFMEDFGSVKEAYDDETLWRIGLRDRAVAVVRRAVESASDAGRRCVTTTFGLSMDQASEAAREAMRVLSLTAADDVPMALLEAAAAHVPGLCCGGGSTSTSTTATAATTMRSAVRELQELSLVTAWKDGSHVSVHRLVQSVVCEGLGESGPIYGDAVSKATASCVPDPDDAWLAASTWTPWLPHVEAVVALADAGPGVYVSAETGDREVVDAVVSGVRGHMELGSLATARSWLGRVRGDAAVVAVADEARVAAAAHWDGVLLKKEGSHESAVGALEAQRDW